MRKGIADLIEKAGYQLPEMVVAMDLDDRDSKDWKRRWSAFLMRFPLWKKMKSKMKKPGGNLFVTAVYLHRRFGTFEPPT